MSCLWYTALSHTLGLTLRVTQVLVLQVAQAAADERSGRQGADGQLQAQNELVVDACMR